MKLIISPASHVASVCRDERPSHLLRLVSPDQAADVADLGVAASLTLIMHDVSQPAPNCVAPDRAMIQTLLDFSGSWSGERSLVAQCWAGVSRSTAAVYIVASQKLPNASERELAAALRRASPQATPNPLMVAHADAILGRSGRMTAAIEEIGRGADFTGFECAELHLAKPAA